MVDCEQLEGIPAAEGRFITPAMGLFYVNAVGDFLPIAIQLKQTRGFHNPLWTPQDKQEDWVLAKMWLRCADSQVNLIALCCTRLSCYGRVLDNAPLSLV
eukprot:m.44082 g.44082  ORF g.44082 m.44082 type:complete len:100 (+) comp33491_c0_seq8:2203-2502(+)